MSALWALNQDYFDSAKAHGGASTLNQKKKKKWLGPLGSN